MYTLNLKKGQVSKAKLKNGIRLTLTGGKEYDQSLLKRLFDEGLTDLVKEEKPKKTKKEETKTNQDG